MPRWYYAAITPLRSFLTLCLYATLIRCHIAAWYCHAAIRRAITPWATRCLRHYAKAVRYFLSLLRSAMPLLLIRHAFDAARHALSLATRHYAPYHIYGHYAILMPHAVSRHYCRAIIYITLRWSFSLATLLLILRHYAIIATYIIIIDAAAAIITLDITLRHQRHWCFSLPYCCCHTPYWYAIVSAPLTPLRHYDTPLRRLFSHYIRHYALRHYAPY